MNPNDGPIPLILPVGDISFFDSVIPGLKGNYTITITPSLTGVEDSSLKIDTQQFTVQAPRFTLDASSDIQFVYPPDKSNMQFEEKLPHIVLTKRSLPWERNLNSDNKTPWIALLVFDENQITPPTPTTNPTKSTVHPLTEVCNFNSGGILGPAITPVDEKLMCQTIDISTETFTDIVPHIEELPFLSHVREVNVGNKAIMKMKHSGWFSVVIANRFPVKFPTGPTKQICHLVSLEGFAEYLVEKPDFPTGINTIRLVSLYSWSFNCLPEGEETFKGLAQHLVSSTSEAGTNLLFKMPQAQDPSQPTPEEQLAYNAINTGFIPISYNTRSSDKTFGWYRGPFSPVVSERFTKTKSDTIPPFESSGEAIIYDQNTGLFNLSYGVAFETGKMLALADKSFAVNLLNWRREANHLVDLLITRLPNNLANKDPTDINTWLKTELISDAYLSYLLGDFSKKIAPKIPSIKNPSQSPSIPPTDPQTAPIFTPPLAPSDLATAIKDFLTQDDAIAVLQNMGTHQLTVIIEWLARLYLLYGVPTNTLLPSNQEDRQILPRESIRFFYLDRAWLDSLIDGAMSIGIHTSKDSLYYKLTKNIIIAGVETLILEMREKEMGLPISPSSSISENMSGFLLRSQLVNGWPGLEVLAYATLDPKCPAMKLLRMDRLSPTLLLCLFPCVPAQIVIREPSEGLCFGVEQGDHLNEEQILLRNISDGKTKHGCLYNVQANDYRTSSNNRVFNIIQLVSNVTSAYNNQLKPNPSITLSPGEFALQMIDVPEQMVFKNTLSTTLQDVTT